MFLQLISEYKKNLLSCAFNMMTSGNNVHQFSLQPVFHSVKQRRIRRSCRQLLIAPFPSCAVLYDYRSIPIIANYKALLEWESDPHSRGISPERHKNAILSCWKCLSARHSFSVHAGFEPAPARSFTECSATELM